MQEKEDSLTFSCFLCLQAKWCHWDC